MVSIVIPNYNGLEYLKRLLLSLEEQSWRHFDVTVVDNGSMDGSVDWLRLREVRVITLPANRGFAAAANLGARETSGEAVFFLNSDTLLDTGCMKALFAALTNHPQYGFFAPKMAQLENRDTLDGAGDIIPPDGRPIKRAANWHTSTPLGTDIMAASGGAAIWRRQLFEKLGGFDRDFFAYLEDVDLCMRAILSGATGCYVPDAVVYHLGAGVERNRDPGRVPSPVVAVHDSPDVVRWVARNKIWLWAKCFPGYWFLRNGPEMALGLIKSAAHHILRSGQGRAFFAGTLEGLTGLPKMVRKRREIQSGRTITNREIGKWIKTASRWW